MKTKILISIGLIFTTSCALRNHTMLPSIDEQCEILSKKQNNAYPKPKKSKRQNLKKDYSILLHQEKQAVQSEESSDLFPQSINVSSLYALNSDKSILYPIEYSENQTQNLSNENISQPVASDTQDKENTINILQSTGRSDSISSSNNQRQLTTNNSIPLLLGASGLLSLFLLKRSQRAAGKLSYWAAKNPWKARTILTSAHVATGVSALTLGNSLFNEGVHFSDASNYISMAAFSTSAILYSSTNAFLRRKFHDTILFTTGTIMLISVGNQYTFTNHDNSHFTIPSYRFTTYYPTIKNSTEKIVTVKDEPQKKNTGKKVGLTVLALILFAALAYGLAALSCSIACSGNEGMAAVVGIGGGIGLIALLVIALRAIYGKSSNKKKQKVATKKSTT